MHEMGSRQDGGKSAAGLSRPKQARMNGIRLRYALIDSLAGVSSCSRTATDVLWEAGLRFAVSQGYRKPQPRCAGEMWVHPTTRDLVKMHAILPGCAVADSAVSATSGRDGQVQ